MQNRLVASLYKESLFEDLLYEDEGLTAERTRVKALLQAYKEAFAVRFPLSFPPFFLPPPPRTSEPTFGKGILR